VVYYPDQSNSDDLVRAGWLVGDVAFSKGPVSATFLARLLVLCLHHRTKQTRGFHPCPFCDNPPIGMPVEFEGRVIKLGSAEIHVRAPDGRTFAAPDLIYHYVVQHGYKPPREFIDAVELVS